MSDLSGWSIISDDDNGSLLVESPQGHRRRIWRDETEEENAELLKRVNELQAENEKLRAEKQRRVYYQDIVYFVCNAIDSIYGGSVVCGTVDEPSDQVQKRIQQLARALKHAKHVLRQVDEHGGPYPQYPELHIALDNLRKAFEGEVG